MVAMHTSQRDRNEFAYMFRELFEELNKIPFKHSDCHPFVKEIAMYARWYFGYSLKYNSADIVWRLNRNYKSIMF